MKIIQKSQTVAGATCAIVIYATFLLTTFIQVPCALTNYLFSNNF
jgi:hypothetical protein